MEVLQNVLHTTDVHDFWHDEGLLPSEKLFSLNWADYNEAKTEILRRLAE